MLYETQTNVDFDFSKQVKIKVFHILKMISTFLKYTYFLYLHISTN